MRTCAGMRAVIVGLICGAIKRVKGSRWAASIPSVSANELGRFTATRHCGDKEIMAAFQMAPYSAYSLLLTRAHRVLPYGSGENLCTI